MARKKSKNENKSTYMYPRLHDAVSIKVIDDIGETRFHKNDTNENLVNKYDTNIMGKFKCPNGSCATHGWGSRRVAICIRTYLDGGYNALVFNQRCKSCDTLGTLTLDEDSYVERVAYRLKKWAGVVMEEPPYSNRDGPPHRSDLCEGCRLGYCEKPDILGR